MKELRIVIYLITFIGSIIFEFDGLILYILYRIKTGFTVTFGMCTPAVCSMNFLQKLLKLNGLADKKVSIKLAENTCQLEEQTTELKTIDWCMM